MAARIEAVTVSTPAGTAIATPQVTNLPPSEEIVTILEIVIPGGHVGLTGIKIFYGNDQVLPWRGSDWIIANDEKLEWEIEGLPTGSAWKAQTYNTDAYAHSHYLRFHVDDLPDPIPAPQLALANIVGASLPTEIEPTQPTEGM